jgi:hypothetical protein
MTIFEIMQSLRAQGYAVLLISPETLSGVHPTDAEEAAWAAIDAAVARQRELDEEGDE